MDNSRCKLAFIGSASLFSQVAITKNAMLLLSELDVRGYKHYEHYYLFRGKTITQPSSGGFKLEGPVDH